MIKGKRLELTLGEDPSDLNIYGNLGDFCEVAGADLEAILKDPPFGIGIARPVEGKGELIIQADGIQWFADRFPHIAPALAPLHLAQAALDKTPKDPGVPLKVFAARKHVPEQVYRAIRGLQKTLEATYGHNYSYRVFAEGKPVGSREPDGRGLDPVLLRLDANQAQADRLGVELETVCKTLGLPPGDNALALVLSRWEKIGVPLWVPRTH